MASCGGVEIDPGDDKSQKNRDDHEYTRPVTVDFATLRRLTRVPLVHLQAAVVDQNYLTALTTPAVNLIRKVRLPRDPRGRPTKARDCGLSASAMSLRLPRG